MYDASFPWSRGYVAFCQREIPEAGRSTENADFITITPWVSSDGRSWEPGEPLNVSGLSDTAGIGDLIQGDDGLLAIGRGVWSDFDHSGHQIFWENAVVGLWTSTDGRAWKRVDLARTFGLPALGDVAAGQAGLIASNLSDQPGTGAPALWLSADAIKWRSVPLSTSDLGEAHIGSVYVLPNGYLIAGWTGTPDGAHYDTEPAVWFSPDGLTWREAPLPGVIAAPTKEAVLVANGPGRYVVRVGEWSCGCEPPRDDQAWISTDGITWEPYSGT